MSLIRPSLLAVSAIFILAAQLICPLRAQGVEPATIAPPFPEGSQITFQWDYSCRDGRGCSFNCPGRGGAGHVTKLTIYLGTISLGSAQTPYMFYEFATSESPRGSGFSVNSGLSTLSCQVNGMSLDYSGPPKRRSSGPTAAK
jgi:hypothetical protein